MLAAVAIHPNEAPRYDARPATLDDALAEIDELAAQPARASRSARPGSTSSAPATTAAPPRTARSRRTSRSPSGTAWPADPRPRRARRRASRPCCASARPSAPCSTASPATPRWRGSAPSTAGTCRSPAPSRSRTRRTCARRSQVTPRALLLVETDAPFLTPTPYRGRPNAPYLLPHTLRAMAEHLGTDVGRARRPDHLEHRTRLRPLGRRARGIRRSLSAPARRLLRAPPVPPAPRPSEASHDRHRHEAESRRPCQARRLLGPAEIRDLAELLGVTPDQEARPELRHRRQHGAPHRQGRRGQAGRAPSSRSGPGSAR